MTQTMKPGEWGTKDGRPAISWWRHGQVTEADTVETQYSLWAPRADAYNSIRNELAKSWDPIYLDAKGSPLPETHRPRG